MRRPILPVVHWLKAAWLRHGGVCSLHPRRLSHSSTLPECSTRHSLCNHPFSFGSLFRFFLSSLSLSLALTPFPFSFWFATRLCGHAVHILGLRRDHHNHACTCVDLPLFFQGLQSDCSPPRRCEPTSVQSKGGDWKSLGEVAGGSIPMLRVNSALGLCCCVSVRLARTSQSLKDLESVQGRDEYPTVWNYLEPLGRMCT